MYVAQHNALMKHALPDARLPNLEQYDIISLGTSDDILEWCKSINPSVTIGVYWMESMEVFDVFIGSVRIRYKQNQIQISILNNIDPDKQNTTSIENVLAETRIRADTFVKNPRVQHIDTSDQSSDNSPFYTPLFYVKNVTIYFETHKSTDMLFSTSVEMESVLVHTLGRTLNLHMSYTELYNHIAQIKHFSVVNTVFKDNVVPYVYTGIGLKQSVAYEKLSLGPSHFHRNVPLSRNVDMGLRDMIFIGPCSDKFVTCAQVKHQILTWDSFTNPYDQMHETIDLSTPMYTTKNVISRRRRNLLQANSNVPVETIQYIDMNSTTFQKHSIATDAEILKTFRFNIRLMVGAETTPGRILSNDNSHNSYENGFDLVVELLQHNQIQISVCGFNFLTTSLNEDVWVEFSLVVVKDEFITFIRDGRQIKHQKLEGPETGVCSVSNNVITIGRNGELASAVGVQLSYMSITSEINLIRTTSIVDMVFETANSSSQYYTWTDTTRTELQFATESYLLQEFVVNPVNTYTEQVGDIMMVFVRIQLDFEGTVIDIQTSIMELLIRINSHLDFVDIPRLNFVENGAISIDILPLLEITYQRKRPLYCDMMNTGVTEYTQSCLYDGLQLPAHSVTFNDHKINIETQSKSLATKTILSDFFDLTEFTLRQQDINIEKPPGAKSYFVTWWGGGYDSEIQFFVRTGPDIAALMIDLRITIPWTLYNDLNVHIGYNDERGVTLRMWTKFEEELIISTSLSMGMSFQHIRIVWRFSGKDVLFEIWVDAEMKEQRIGWVPFPTKGDVVISSRMLHFFDAFREITNIHLASTTADICQCSSQCGVGYYGGNCTKCPPFSRTISNGTVNEDDCVCVYGYTREDPNDPASCVRSTFIDLATYNISASLLKGFCTPSGNSFGEEAQCQGTDRKDGCSCKDDCIDATGDDPPCCRNKCAACPSADFCECMWDSTVRKVYNNRLLSREWDGLCAGAICDIGEFSDRGMCTPCPEHTYKPELSDTTTQCKPCAECALIGYFREACFGSSPGKCTECTTCPDGMKQATPCSSMHDRTCIINSDSCAGNGMFLRGEGDCVSGTYHAGCDPMIGEMGWCEACPVQDASECSEGFFMNFNCSNDTPLSLTPNECLPCNRFECEDQGTFPSAIDCGDPDKPETMRSETIKCSRTCSEPTGDVWIKRECQYFFVDREPDE
jgi:hypothetical protein